ncbi:MAG: ABC transporter substrate-binding protein [Ramlibacter sp.]|nr:ABC transporter substrate-binding protein [Ramlibacter sp.]
MTLKATLLIATAALTIGFAAPTPAFAQISGDTIKIGLLGDMSGPASDYGGSGAAEAMKMAIEDIGGSINGKKIELLTFDHQNKADVAANKAREWLDQQGVDTILVIGSSAAALSAAKIAWEKKKVYISNSASIRLTNEECTPYSIRWTTDTVALANGTGGAVIRQGGKSWFFLTMDLAFGTSMEADTTRVIKSAGGTVAGSVRHPLSASDFSSFLLQAQASRAEILGLATAGSDFVNVIKAANEFGVTKNMKMAALLMYINEVHALGLPLTQNMYLTDSWYWDQSPESRQWSKRFFDKMKKMPSSLQASNYSAIYQYLSAVKAIGTDDADKVMAKMRATKFNDMYAKNGTLRPDGSMVQDVYLMQVKSPAESKAPWDYLKVLQVIPGDQAYTPKSETKCQFWK